VHTHRLLLRGVQSIRNRVRPDLGPLEHRVMEALWRRGEANVRDVHGEFGDGVAYTTVMTTLDRWVMLATPDLFGTTRVGERTAERWAAAAERIADEEAVRGDVRAASSESPRLDLCDDDRSRGRRRDDCVGRTRAPSLHPRRDGVARRSRLVARCK
jgi:hypothetical protein